MSAPPQPAAQSNHRATIQWPSETPSLAPPAIVVPAVEGWGKTSMAAHSPDPVILMARGEAGYITLYNAGRVPRVPYVECNTFDETLAAIDGLIADPQGRKTLCLDALGGFERLCHEKVCAREFGGQWGEKGFNSFQRGYDTSISDWLMLLARLDKLRATTKMTVLILSHVKVETFKNPAGPDFDRYAADVHRKTWAVTSKWSDAVLFGNFLTVVKESKGKAKGIGGNDRIIYTERCDAWDAKNRYGAPAEIDIPNDPTKIWETIWNAITGVQA